MNALVVNLFAGPCAGKSTTAAGVFCNLKKAGVNCELVTEFTKELTWESRHLALDNQIYILGEQYHRFYRVVKQVDVIITDTSFVYGCMYAPPEYFPSFKPLVVEIFNSMHNANYFIERRHRYSSTGRNQTEEEAWKIDQSQMYFLLELGITYTLVPGNDEGIEIIIEDVLRKLEHG